MNLEVKPATSDHIEFAWSIYGPFVRENLFSGLDGLKGASHWSHDVEQAKFREAWENSDQYVISVDSEVVGWIAAKQVGAEITIENLMITPAWRGRNITETFLTEMAKEWKSSGTVVRGDVFKKSEFSDSKINIAKRSGFSEISESDSHIVFHLN